MEHVLGTLCYVTILNFAITSLFREFWPKVQLERLIFDEINYIVTLLNAARDREKRVTWLQNHEKHESEIKLEFNPI